MGQRYQRQLAEVERCRVQRQLAAQTEEPPHVRLCEPLCGLLRGGAVSLPPEKDFKPFSSRFSGVPPPLRRTRTGFPPKPSEAGSVGRGDAAE